jgi:N,N-dimethylformamidase
MNAAIPEAGRVKPANVTRLLGYCDRLTYRQGEVVEVRAAGPGAVEASLVRLNRPPDDPAWPLPLTSPVESVPAVRAVTDPQPVYPGSYVVVEDVGPLAALGAATISMYAMPTLLASGHPQVLASTISSDAGRGFAVLIDSGGQAALWWGRGASGPGRLTSPVPLIQGYWHVVSVSVDEDSGTAALAHYPVTAVPGGLGRWSGSAADPALRAASDPVLLIGAGRLPGHPPAIVLPGTPGLATSFNGKIERPVLLAADTAAPALESLTPDAAASQARQVIGAWDFSHGQDTAQVRDSSGEGRHGITVNRPARAVTGVLWNGTVHDWTVDPGHYGAIHFHDDDLEDCLWPVVATVQLPADLPSAVYGIALQQAGGDDSDVVPVIVTPAPGREGSSNGSKNSAGGSEYAADALIVLPSFTYIAYANMIGNPEDLDYVAAGLAAGPAPEVPGHRRLTENPQIAGSAYDVHSDGSAWMYSTPRRPLLSCRPDWKNGARQSYRHLGADLYLPAWLDKLGVSYHVVTDHTVHAEGASLLGRYPVCLTGSHPEYISSRVRDAFAEYLGHGGSLLYLGGNGFYWVTAQDESVPELVEVRRGFNGTRTWTSAPGECYHSVTGELGGLWRYRQPPNALVGVGMTAQGADGGAAGYARGEPSYDGPAAFLFDGVTSEVIGSRGYDMGAAAGDEVDRFDVGNGSPPWAVVVATSLPLTRYYKLAVEEIQITRDNTGGDREPRVRADLVYVEQESGGFVFSAGSISWVQSMAVDYFAADTARVTENALRAAIARGARRPPEPGEPRAGQVSSAGASPGASP